MPEVQDCILGDGTNQDTESRDSSSVNNAEQEERAAQQVPEEAFPGKNKEWQLPQRRMQAARGFIQNARVPSQPRRAVWCNG